MRLQGSGFRLTMERDRALTQPTPKPKKPRLLLRVPCAQVGFNIRQGPIRALEAKAPETSKPMPYVLIKGNLFKAQGIGTRETCSRRSLRVWRRTVGTMCGMRHTRIAVRSSSNDTAATKVDRFCFPLFMNLKHSSSDNRPVFESTPGL